MTRRTAVFAAVLGLSQAVTTTIVLGTVSLFRPVSLLGALAAIGSAFVAGAALVVGFSLWRPRPIDLGDVASHRGWTPGPDGVVTTRLPEAGDRP